MYLSYKLIFFIKPPCGSECKLYMSFSKLRELCYFIFLFIAGLQVHIIEVFPQVGERWWRQQEQLGLTEQGHRHVARELCCHLNCYQVTLASKKDTYT